MFDKLKIGPLSSQKEISQEGTKSESNPQLPPPSSSPSEAESQAGSIASDEPSHFDDLIAEPIPAGSGGGDGGQVTPMLGKDEFFKLFVGGFTVAGALTQLKSLKVEETDEKARAASDALYETISDIPALHFLLEPQGKWMGRVVCIGMFVVPMSLNVRNELAARASVKPKQAGPGKTATAGTIIVPNPDMSGKNERP